MNTIASYTDFESILKIVNAAYCIGGHRIVLHRDLIGRVYFIDGADRRTVLKMYRGFHTDNALQTVDILNYLKQNDYPAVSVIPTGSGGTHVSFDTPEGRTVGILYDYVEGATPDIDTETEGIGAQIGRLHKLMQGYPRSLPNRTKSLYIDDYLGVLEEMGYDPGRVAQLAEYGDELWKRLVKLPRGFCHGDMHTGNMLRLKDGRFVLFDFDEASGDYPIVDVAYLSDATNFNRFLEGVYEKTMLRFERFYEGYRKECALSEPEVAAIPDVVAIRHYTILGRIIQCQGTQDISREFLDEQYEWLLEWRNLSQRKRL